MFSCPGMRDRFLPLPDALPLVNPWPGGGASFRGADRRAIYQRALPLALLGTLLPLALVWPATSAFRVTALGMAALLVVMLALSLLPRCPLWVLDALLLLGGWSLVLGELAFTLFTPETARAPTALGHVLPWFLLLLLAPTWLLGERRGRVLSRSALGLTLGLTAVYAAAPLLPWGTPWGAASSGLLGLLAQLLLAGGITVMGQEAAAWRARDLARRGAWAGLSDDERDPLTGLPQRKALQRLLTAHLRRQGEGLTVAVLSLDTLEDIEAERGVAFAEALRAHLARILSAAVREGDVVGCLERGHFAVLMRVPDARAARVACERLRLRAASRPLGGVLANVSVGVAVWNGHTGGRALLADAQEALSHAQTRGGNCVYLVRDPSRAAA